MRLLSLLFLASLLVGCVDPRKTPPQGELLYESADGATRVVAQGPCIVTYKFLANEWWEDERECS